MTTQTQQEPVAYLVTGPYEKRPFADIGSATAYCNGLNKGWGETVYSVSPLYTTPQPAAQQEPVAWRRKHYPLCEKCSQATVPMKDTCGWSCDGTPNNDWYVPINPPQPAQQEPVAFSQFLSDVVTAAGLLSHGKTDKTLAARISEFAFRLRLSPQPQAQPLTDEMVTAAARALNKRQAEACGVDKNDHWKFYGDDIKEDARAVLEAAHGITKGNT